MVYNGTKLEIKLQWH